MSHTIEKQSILMQFKIHEGVKNDLNHDSDSNFFMNFAFLIFFVKTKAHSEVSFLLFRVDLVHSQSETNISVKPFQPRNIKLGLTDCEKRVEAMMLDNLQLFTLISHRWSPNATPNGCHFKWKSIRILKLSIIKSSLTTLPIIGHLWVFDIRHELSPE